MVAYQEVVTEILNHIPVMPAEEKPLLRCLGQAAFEDIYSRIRLPRQAGCIPDGYALQAADIQNASRETPVTLQIIETVRAGVLPQRTVKSGTAARVMTGSVLPKGADCVVRFEDSDEPADKCGPNRNRPSEVKIFTAASAGTNVVVPGSIVQRGTRVVPKGTIIGPAQISALTTVGESKIKVHRRPVIGIIATGDELMPSGRPLPRGKSYNSNTAALAALVLHHGGIPKVLGIARDNQASLEKKILRGMTTDAIISSGGVSKGDFDLVRLVLSRLGQVVFATVPMAPGKAMSFGWVKRKDQGGKLRRIPLFALSGPPAGCLVNFETLVRPALRRMLGYSMLRHQEVEAEAVDSVSATKAFAFVKWTCLEETETGYRVRFAPEADRGLLPVLANANSLTVLPQGAAVKPGDTIKVLPLDFCL